jgi:dihydroorotase-like cyclic amidohydrolase
VAADVKAVPTFSVEQQRTLFSMASYVREGSIQSYDVSADDSRFVMIREGEPSQQSELIVAENWLQTLKGKVDH